ncbi:unnamed protein product [Acanthoscelides obtectus]|uniref:Uncharacterized protein n=1 Tax=Acanthoscelides obtectus TaxID=200917 RepID=A0A9P0M991_ACAOB|nr:unnamed protein product [Acanthoscelides obtectus]CAK1625360.1 hypothetical protein AOBTE_LOCUS3124 [Acanthoscelides obtectus]
MLYTLLSIYLLEPVVSSWLFSVKMFALTEKRHISKQASRHSTRHVEGRSEKETKQVCKFL